jgi:cyclohexyl-isocyanide hydratase
MHGQTHLAWKTLDPVPSDSGPAIVPTTTFAECPMDLDVLFVPGGLGTAAVMDDADVLRFLAERAPRAKYVTSVCSGSLILAAAGLLDGYRATTHWAAYDALAAFGVDVSDERVVIDRNRLTGGGVTAGIDFGLTLLAQLRGDAVAQMTQLAMEYDPAPPFDAGSPKRAAPELVELTRNAIADTIARSLAIAASRNEQRALSL